MPQIDVRDETFQKLSEQARSQGFADLPSYLDGLADDGHVTVMSPELEMALQDGLKDIRQGRVFSEETVREDMARLRRERVEKAA